MKKAILAYVPAIHQGYLNLFSENNCDIYVMGSGLIKEIISEDGFSHYSRDLRAVNPKSIVRMLNSELKGQSASLFEVGLVDLFRTRYSKIILPEEDISKFVGKKYLSDFEVEYSSKHFLRYHKQITLRESEFDPDEEVTFDEMHQRLMSEALEEAQKSADWWRQVGFVIVTSGGKIVKGFNCHMPTQHEPDVAGDARSNFKPGEHADLCTAIHSEQFGIATCARHGYATDGATIYVTTLPCPVCARNIVVAGIQNVYYESGYSKFDAYEIFKSGGVNLIRVGK